jgi:hypothetical protein
LKKSLDATAIISQVPKPSKSQKQQTTLRIYNTLEIPTLLYGSEISTLNKVKKARITVAEIKYLKPTANISYLTIKKNHDVLEDFKTKSTITNSWTDPYSKRLLRNIIQHINI